MADVNLDDIAATIERIIEREVSMIENNEEGLPRQAIQNLETLSKVLTICEERRLNRRSGTGEELTSTEDLLRDLGVEDE